MATVGASEAKTHFSKLLERAGRGERITITKRGKPIAVLAPLENDEPEMPLREAIEGLRNFPRVRLPKGLTIKDLIEEGRDPARAASARHARP